MKNKPVCPHAVALLSMSKEALPAQIARVSAKMGRWEGYHRDMEKMRAGSGAGMLMSIAIMNAAIKDALDANASGDIVRMMRAHETLAEYNDDD